MKYFSKSRQAFFDDEVFGARTKLVPASDEVDAELIYVANPDCRLPSDAEPISDANHAGLLQALSSGKLISWEGEVPVAIDPPATTPAELWAQLQRAALLELDANDKVYTRCGKAGVPYPPDWLAYDEALRLIVRTPNGEPDAPMPPRPDYPAGT